MSEGKKNTYERGKREESAYFNWICSNHLISYKGKALLVYIWSWLLLKLWLIVARKVFRIRENTSSIISQLHINNEPHFLVCHKQKNLTIKILTIQQQMENQNCPVIGNNPRLTYYYCLYSSINLHVQWRVHKSNQKQENRGDFSPNLLSLCRIIFCRDFPFEVKWSGSSSTTDYDSCAI